MTLISLFMIALALSLDAFAVSISCGIKIRSLRIKIFVKIALCFGVYQALMPLIGWSFGHLIIDFVSQYAHWISAAIFGALAVKTFKEFFENHHEETCGAACECRNWRCLLGLGLATSIDALLVGLVLALYQIHLIFSVSLIGLVTFAMSMLGLFIGNRASAVLGRWAHFVSGLLLLGLAVDSFL